MPTDFTALDALYPLPPDELPRQWLLTRDEAALPLGWARRSLNGWYLASHADAHVCELEARDGAVLGWAIEPLAYLGATGGFVTNGAIPLPVDAGASFEQIERALYGREGRSQGSGLVGTWVAVIFGEAENTREGRVYLSAAHSAVYHPERRTVATTHNLLPGLRRDEALSRAVDPLATNAHYTFGLTAFEGLRRLLPNHYLDLKTFQPTRHWPSGALEPLAEGEAGAAAIVEYARRLVEMLGPSCNAFQVFLSAGRDSRAVLACMHPYIAGGGTVVASTSYDRSPASRQDLYAARHLAGLAGLPHHENRLRPHDGTAEDVMRGFVRIGEARAGSFLSAPGTDTAPATDGVFKLGGMGGELGRAYYWRGRSRTGAVTPEELVRRTKSPATDAVLAAASNWLADLPKDIRADAAATFDLAYVEQRLGCWRAPSTYLFPSEPCPGPQRVLNPMAEAAAIEIMVRLPEPYRRRGVLQYDMVAYGWPQLLDIPFNAPFGLRALLHKVDYRLRQLWPGLAKTTSRRKG